jgi:adenosine kinase
MSQVLVSGSIAYDRIMDFPGLFSSHFVPERLHNLSVSFQVDTFNESFGGCAGNVAYNLALLGEKPVILSTAGNDFERYATYLRERGVSTESVHLVQEDTTATAYVMTDRGDNQIAAYYAGAGKRPYGAEPSLTGVVMASIGAGCSQDMVAFARYYREHKVPYVCDPGQQLTELAGEQLLDLVTGASVLFCNDYELGLIIGKTGLSEKVLLARVPTIVATMGERGARLIMKDSELHIDAVPVTSSIDPTGAGDAHRAGFVKGMLAGLPMEQCARLGSTVAAYAVETYGTQNYHFTMDELKTRFEKTYGNTWPL